MSDAEDSGKGPLAQMSEKLTEQTDVQVESVSLVVTKGPDVEGNEITAVAHHGEESSENDVLLGFDSDTFDETAKDFATSSDAALVELFPEDGPALEKAIEEAEPWLDTREYDRLRTLADSVPGGEVDE